MKEFEARKRRLDLRRLKAWTAAIEFFEDKNRFIKNQRNAYGGHLHADLAQFVLDHVEQTDDSPGALEVTISDDHTSRFVFKFAETIISNALSFGRGGRDHAEFLPESFQILADAMRHADQATQVLADVYILPSFGWGP